MLKNWLKVFLYNTKKNKLFTVLNTLGLSIGITGVIFSLLYWEDENSYEKWNPELENVYEVFTVFDDMDLAYVPMGLKFHIEEMSGVECSYAQPSYTSSSIKIEDKEYTNNKIFNTGKSFFKLYPFKFLKGDSETCFTSDNSAVITQQIAKTYFGNESPIGKTFEFKKLLYTVNGVFEVPGKSGIQPEIITNSIATTVEELKSNWNHYQYALWIKIDDKNNVENIKNKFNKLCFTNLIENSAKKEGVTTEEYIKEYGNVFFRFTSLKNIRLKEPKQSHPEGKGNYQLLLTLLVLSLLILILSIVNYINLATANAIKRGKEVGVRKVIGATRSNIVSQFIFETVITMLFTVIISLCILEITLPFFNDFLNKDLTVYSFRFLSQILGVMTVVVLFAGVFPAIYISNFESTKVLKGNFDRSKSGLWLRNGMLILQFA